MGNWNIENVTETNRSEEGEWENALIGERELSGE